MMRNTIVDIAIFFYFLQFPGMRSDGDVTTQFFQTLVSSNTYYFAAMHNAENYSGGSRLLTLQ
jgi:hypothetical protein